MPLQRRMLSPLRASVTARLVLATSLWMAIGGALLWACSSDNAKPPPAPLPGPNPDPTDGGTLDRITVPVCTGPATGCPCSPDAGDAGTVNCTTVDYRSGNYVACTQGVITCEANGKWSECKGLRVATVNPWQLAGKHMLAQPQGVDAGNVCDPYLFQITSLLSDNTHADGSVVSDDSGVYLAHGASAATGCGDAGTLTIAPLGPTALVLTAASTPPSPNSVQFTATLPACAGGGGISPTWTVDRPDIATIGSDGKLVVQVPYAGPIIVTAYAGDLSAASTVNVTVNVVDTSKDIGGVANSFLTICGGP